MTSVLRWLGDMGRGLGPILLAILAGLALAFGLRKSGEIAGRRAAEAEQEERRRKNERAQIDAAASYRRDGAAERLRRGDF